MPWKCRSSRQAESGRELIRIIRFVHPLAIAKNHSHALHSNEDEFAICSLLSDHTDGGRQRLKELRKREGGGGTMREKLS